MSDTALRADIKQMIVDRLFLDRKGITADAIADDADLMEAYGIDSVELFEIVVGMDEEYNVVLPEDEFSIERFQTVDRLVELAQAAAA